MQLPQWSINIGMTAKQKHYNGWRQNQGQLELFQVDLCDVLIYIHCITLIDGNQHTLNVKTKRFSM